jgi:hypothetical protein
MEIKGVEDLYEECCGAYDKRGRKFFYIWKSGDIFEESDICLAPIWYSDSRLLTIEEFNYDPIREEDSTWKISDFSVPRDRRLCHRSYKFINLERDDDLVLLKCKIRPVVLLKSVESKWRYPRAAEGDKFWMAVPIFTYKKRHLQQCVVRDQALLCPFRFYMPPRKPKGPGLEEEGAARFDVLQFIPESNLQFYKVYDLKRQMRIPVKLFPPAFMALVGHLAIFLPGVELTGKTVEWYGFFRELVWDLVKESLSEEDLPEPLR